MIKHTSNMSTFKDSYTTLVQFSKSSTNHSSPIPTDRKALHHTYSTRDFQRNGKLSPSRTISRTRPNTRQAFVEISAPTTKEQHDRLDQYILKKVDLKQYYSDNTDYKAYIDLLVPVLSHVELIEDLVPEKAKISKEDNNLISLEELRKDLISDKNILDLEKCKEIIKSLSRLTR